MLKKEILALKLSTKLPPAVRGRPRKKRRESSKYRKPLLSVKNSEKIPIDFNSKFEATRWIELGK
jgi:hypothetical protein